MIAPYLYFLKILLSGLILGSFPKNNKVRFFLAVLSLFEGYIYCKIFLKFNVYFLVLNMLICIILIFYNKYFNLSLFFKNFSIFNFIKNTLTISMLVSFFIFCLSFLFYLELSYSNYNNYFLNNFILVPKINLSFSVNLFLFSYKTLIYLSLDFFSFIILFLVYLVGFYTILTLDTRLY